jgi:hypothetical protein
VVWPKQERLCAVIPFRHGFEDALDRVAARHIAAREHGKGAETEATAQNLAPIDTLQQPPVLLEHALVDSAFRSEEGRRRSALRHDA